MEEVKEVVHMLGPIDKLSFGGACRAILVAVRSQRMDQDEVEAILATIQEEIHQDLEDVPEDQPLGPKAREMLGPTIRMQRRLAFHIPVVRNDNGPSIETD